MALGRTRTLAIRQSLYITARTGLVVGGWFLGGYMGIILGRAASGIIYPAYNLALGASLTGTRALQPLLAAWRSFAAAATMAAAILPFHGQDWGAMSWPTLAATLAGLVALGGSVYAATHLLLWLLSGRPAGAEQRILSLVAQVTRK
jgi:hypothetical protein